MLHDLECTENPPQGTRQGTLTEPIPAFDRDLVSHAVDDGGEFSVDDGVENAVNLQEESLEGMKVFDGSRALLVRRAHFVVETPVGPLTVRGGSMETPDELPRACAILLVIPSPIHRLLQCSVQSQPLPHGFGKACILGRLGICRLQCILELPLIGHARPH